MDEVTIALGKSLRDFQEKTCSAFDTRELQREARARKKRQTKASATKNEGNGSENNKPQIPGEASPSNDGEQSIPLKPPVTKKRKRTGARVPTSEEDPTFFSDRLDRLKKPLNLNTYKNHSIGDYTEAIRMYGTTDSYSTERVNLFNTFHGTVTYIIV